MKLNFRKISSVLASAVMLGSTIGIAAAAAYPAPFVSGSSSDVAVVFGGDLDKAAALDISSNLNAALGTSSTTTGGKVTTTGETAPLFGGTKLYFNDSLDAVKTVITKTNLPTTLADTTFSGNVDAKVTSTIQVGHHPIITLDKMPTSSDDPRFGLSIGTSGVTQPVLNLTTSFSKAVNLTHADSEGQEIVLFGQKFTIAAATSGTDLVLLKAATKVSLDTTSPSQDVTIGSKKYTIELISASDTAATIKVTNEAGASEQKEVSEAASKKINGVTIAVNTADETNLKLAASIIAGADKVTLTNNTAIKYGEDDTTLDGTNVVFDNGPTSASSIKVTFAAKDSDKDAVFPGNSLVDPVFGTIKLDFGGLNIADTSSDREDIIVRNNGDDKMEINFKTHNANEARTVRFAKNGTRMDLAVDDSGHNITVFEGAAMYKSDYVVVGNEDQGYLLKLITVTNSSSSTAGDGDKVELRDVFTDTTYTSASTTTEGSSTISIGGKDYAVTYRGASTNSDTIAVRLNYPDSSGNNLVVFPTIDTSKGAALFFYKPINISLSDWDGAGADVAGLRFPDGDGYTDATIVIGNTSNYTLTIGSTTTRVNQSTTQTGTIGRLTYNFTGTGGGYDVNDNNTVIYLTNVNGGNIAQPAIVIFEEKDDDNDYEALIVTIEDGTTSDDGIGVNDVQRTWNTDATATDYTYASDSKKAKGVDLWGSVIFSDTGDSDQKKVTISYPDEQIYAQIYVSSKEAIVSAGGATSIVPMKDSEVDSTTTKNLIVVGGSCINTVAAKLLTGNVAQLCGADFTAKTTVGAGEFLIETFGSPYAADKVATLVAGYEAADTTNAAKALVSKSNTVDTTAGKKYKGTTAEGALTAA
ncbi:hypothetical protein HYW74_00700 [Candidatus Pacearchaeota archaeon]|nr:hypothetical protein [Candidatus Pacearchaeota archaeon]